MRKILHQLIISILITLNFLIAGVIHSHQIESLYPRDEFIIDRSFVYGPANGSQTLCSIVFADSCYFIVWEDWRNGNADIYGTRMTLDGVVFDSIGISISTASRYQSSPEVVLGNNTYFVVWEDYRSGGNPVIYGARVNQNGIVLDTAGIPISAAYCHSPDVAYDGTNYFVIWEDERNGYDNCDIYGARVTCDGIVLDPGGIPISTAGSRQEYPAIAYDGVNYLVVWEDRRNGESDIYGSRVSPDGIVLDPAGIPISTANNAQILPSIAFNGDIYLVVWDDYRNGMQDIYGTRVTPAGIVLDSAGIPVCVVANNQSCPAVSFDGTNFMVTWEDDRNGTCDIYGARISAAGIVIDTTGIPITTVLEHQNRPALAFDTAYYLVVWEDSRNCSTTTDIYGTRIKTDGGVIDTSGVLISTNIYFFHQDLPAILFNGTDYFVVWEEERNNSNYNIYGARIDRSGAVLDTVPIPISTSRYLQKEPSIAFDGTNYFVVWRDSRNEIYSSDIYGARINTSGIIIDTMGIPITTRVNDQRQPVIAFDGMNYLIVWADRRNSIDYDIYGAKVNTQGAVLDTIIILDTPGYQWQPAIAFDGINYFVVWEDYRNYKAEIYGTRINRDGVVIDTNGIPISLSLNYCCNPAIAFDGVNYLIAWEENRPGTYWDIIGCRVNQSGVLIDSTPIIISNAPNSQWSPAVKFDGLCYNIVWQDSRNNHWDIYGASVSREGTVTGSFNVSSQAGEQVCPAITANGDSIFVVYSGWCDAIVGFPANTMRIWGKFLVPTGIVEENNQDYDLTAHRLSVYPNPFRNHCVIKFQIPSTKSQTNSNYPISIKIYNSIGQLVKRFNHLTNYQSSILWLGDDNSGEKVSSGVYFIHLETSDGNMLLRKKIIKLK